LAEIGTTVAGKRRKLGRRAEDNRRFINAVFWILRTGTPWRDLPASYGGWKTRIVGFADGETKAFGKS